MKKTLITILYITFLISQSVLNIHAQDASPEITIYAPKDNQSFNNEVIDLLYEINNFTHVDYKNNRELFPGNSNAGHAHLWLISRTTGEGSDDIYKILSADQHHFGSLESGRYRVVIELVRNDHSSFDAPVFDQVDFNVGSDGSMRGKYSVTDRVEREFEGSPPFMAGVQIPLIAIIFISLLILILLIVFRKKLKLDKRYNQIKFMLIHKNRKIDKHDEK